LREQPPEVTTFKYRDLGWLPRGFPREIPVPSRGGLTQTQVGRDYFWIHVVLGGPPQRYVDSAVEALQSVGYAVDVERGIDPQTAHEVTTIAFVGREWQGSISVDAPRARRRLRGLTSRAAAFVAIEVRRA
jgi:hypothetical protein